MRLVSFYRTISYSCFAKKIFFNDLQGLAPLNDRIQQDYSNLQIFPISCDQTVLS